MPRCCPDILLILLICCLCTAHSEAQRRFEGYLLGGGNLSQIDGDKLSGFNKIGLQGGARVHTIFTDRWEMSVGMLYSQQGASRNLNDSPSAVFERIQLNLVEVPVLVHFNDWKFQVGAGLSYARLINYSVEDIFGEDVTDQQTYNDNLLQVVAGVTFRFSERFGLNVRWSRQLNDLQADPGAGTYIARAIGIRGLYKL